MTQQTVVHIAAHMGGGVGKVLSNVALEDTNYDHHIVLLEKPVDTVFTDKLRQSQLTIAPSIDVIQELAGWSDIVQFDWWGHPLLARVMYEVRDVPVRSVIWSHTAGCYYPYISPRLVNMPDAFIFSSKYSAENPFWTLTERSVMKNIHFINSSGGFAATQNVQPVPHDGFNIGYVGTLGYMKLNPEFVQYCKLVSDIPGVKFVMIGRIPEPNLILQQAEEERIADKFEFTGWVPDLPAELAKLDVLGYLLNPYHFGTTENALLEAMSMGFPPVCFDQCAEKYLIKHDVSGYLVKSRQAYKNCITALYAHPILRKEIGVAAREHVLKSFDLDTTIRKLGKVYDTVSHHDKRKMDITNSLGDTPYQWYRDGQPPGDTSMFSKYLTDSTKGSVAQWHKYFPDDKLLAKMVNE